MPEPISSSEDTTARGGVVDAALFSRVEQLIQSVRLTQDERIAVETGGVASEVHTARKEFDMGHLDQSLRAVVRVSASFDQLVTQWESLARRKEQHRQNLSMLQIRKMHAEHTGVRTRVQLVRAQLRRLRGGLDQLEKMTAGRAAEGEGAERQSNKASGSERTVAEPTENIREVPIPLSQPVAAVPAPSAESTPISIPQAASGPRQLPPGFLEAFRAARDAQERTQVVQQYFDVEAKLDVEIRTEGGKDRAVFAPFSVPPANRFYFLLSTAQVIRTRRARIVGVIHVHYPDTGKSQPIPLKHFVEHVRDGVWLLRPKSPADQGETSPA